MLSLRQQHRWKTPSCLNVVPIRIQIVMFVFESDGSCSSCQQDHFELCSSFLLSHKRLQECTQHCRRRVHSLHNRFVRSVKAACCPLISEYAFALTHCRAGTKASDSGKVTLSLDHVLDALKDAGFEDMVSAVSLQVNGKHFRNKTITFIAHMHHQLF